MSIAIEEHPELNEDLAPVAVVEPHKIKAPTGLPEIATPLGILDARLQVLEFLIEKELDDLRQLDQRRCRIKDRLYALGKEREAVKRVAKAFNDEADITTDERITE